MKRMIGWLVSVALVATGCTVGSAGISATFTCSPRIAPVGEWEVLVRAEYSRLDAFGGERGFSVSVDTDRTIVPPGWATMGSATSGNARQAQWRIPNQYGGTDFAGEVAHIAIEHDITATFETSFGDVSRRGTFTGACDVIVLPPPGTPPAVDLSGDWDFTVRVTDTDCESGTSTWNLSIAQSGSAVTVTGIPDDPSATWEGSVSGRSVTFAGDRPEDGGRTASEITAMLDGQQLVGEETWLWTGASGTCAGASTVTGVKPGS